MDAEGTKARIIFALSVLKAIWFPRGGGAERAYGHLCTFLRTFHCILCKARPVRQHETGRLEGQWYPPLAFSCHGSGVLNRLSLTTRRR